MVRPIFADLVEENASVLRCMVENTKGGYGMKKFLALVAALILTVAALPALADGGQSGDVGEVISMRASLRTAASTSAERICYISNGESFDILDENEEWYYVEFHKDGATHTGWILQCYVVKNPIHLVARNSGVLYASPSLTDKRVGTFGRYEKFTVIEETSRYYLVSCRNAAAFISRSVDYWTDEDLEILDNVLYVATVTEKTGLYLTASTKTKLATIKVGTQFDVLGHEGDYTIVKYENAYAYIPTDDILRDTYD